MVEWFTELIKCVCVIFCMGISFVFSFYVLGDLIFSKIDGYQPMDDWWVLSAVLALAFAIFCFWIIFFGW